LLQHAQEAGFRQARTIEPRPSVVPHKGTSTDAGGSGREPSERSQPERDLGGWESGETIDGYCRIGPFNILNFGTGSCERIYAFTMFDRLEVNTVQSGFGASMHKDTQRRVKARRGENYQRRGENSQRRGNKMVARAGASQKIGHGIDDPGMKLCAFIRQSLSCIFCSHRDASGLDERQRQVFQRCDDILRVNKNKDEHLLVL
jgi:hypothetical protein